MLDVVVVGGGIVGLSVATSLATSHPERTLTVLEKEAALATHQTGRNSGVIHSGIYYRPGSLKARTVTAGRQALLRFCRDEGVAHDLCGKVVVAVEEAELARLHVLAERGRRNGVRVDQIGPERLRELEPHVAGVAALHVPDAGIVDFAAVAAALARRLQEAGGEVRLRCRVETVTERDRSVLVRTSRGELEARFLVNCAGLFADVVAGADRPRSGSTHPIRIVPFRGEYYALVPSRAHLVRNLVYPVPDPAFPFLGVHFTRMISGGVHAGPNAVLALSREGYTWGDVDVREVATILRYPGFRPLARRYWRTGIGEIHRSLSKRAFVRALQRLVPEVGAADLVPSLSGVRAQALDAGGELLDDFAVRESPRAVHVLNAPSPAATAALEIGRVVAERLATRF